MLCIEVRGGVVVAAYSDETSEIIIVDYDDKQAAYLPTDSTSSIPDDALNLMNRLPHKDSWKYRGKTPCN